MQVESDICEQLPAVNLQKTFCSSLPPEESLEAGGGLSVPESSLLQAENVNAKASEMPAANVIFESIAFITNSFFER
jgi:hypothetical protein